MPVDHIRYDILVQEALRGMVRDVLAETAKGGLAGDHHFYITFDTTAEGVKLSDRLRERYPEAMTVVLQHQFWDLKVTDELFEVGLSFGGVAERLVVPLAAIKEFKDPAVQFMLQFETLTGTDEEAEPAKAAKSAVPRDSREPKPQAAGKGPARPSVPASPLPPPADTETGAGKPEDGPGTPGGAEVVRLDRFRKK